MVLCVRDQRKTKKSFGLLWGSGFTLAIFGLAASWSNYFTFLPKKMTSVSK
jgi:hypothetical protein